MNLSYEQVINTMESERRRIDVEYQKRRQVWMDDLYRMVNSFGGDKRKNKANQVRWNDHREIILKMLEEQKTPNQIFEYLISKNVDVGYTDVYACLVRWNLMGDQNENTDSM